MKQPKRRRYNQRDMNRVREMVSSICRWLFDTCPTHTEYLDLRTWILSGSKDPCPAKFYGGTINLVLDRLPLYATRSFLDQLDGVWITIGRTQVSWCFFIDGRFMDSKVFSKTGRKYAEIDNDLSRHVWTKTLDSEVQKVW